MHEINRVLLTILVLHLVHKGDYIITTEFICHYENLFRVIRGFEGVKQKIQRNSCS